MHLLRLDISINIIPNQIEIDLMLIETNNIALPIKQIVFNPDLSE